MTDKQIMSICNACGAYECNMDNCKIQEQLDQLKAENDEFKKWKETTVELFDRTCRCKHLNEENAHCSFYDRECISINQCLYKNQQTLTEIKELVNKLVDNKGYAEREEDIILRKISECEVNDGI